MKKKFLIVILFVQCQTVATEQIHLSFKPFDRITYYSCYDFKTPSFPEKMKSTGSIKMANILSFDKRNGNLELYMNNVIREPAGPSLPN